MKTKLISAVSGAAMLAFAGSAAADEPLRLSDAQLDGVSAGAIAVAESGSVTIGDALSETVAAANTIALGSVLAFAEASATGLAVSVATDAVSASGSLSAAALP